MSKAVKVRAWRSASVAVGAVTVWPPGCGAAGPAVVVVWPFSSVEREKMTLPWGCASCVAERVWVGMKRGGGGWTRKRRAESRWQSCAEPRIGSRGPLCDADEMKLHEPRPFCFFGLRSTACSSLLDERCGRSGSSAALAGGFVEDDGSGGGDVEGADAAGHGNAQQVVAGAADEIVQARALAAKDDDEIAGEVELVVVGFAAFVETDDPEVVPLEVFEGADEIDDAGDAEVLGCAGAGFDGGGTEGSGAALGEEDAIDSGAIGHAEQSAEVLRIFDAVEGEDEAGGGARPAGANRSSMERNSCGRTSATTPWWAGVLAVSVSCSRGCSRTRTPASRHWATRLARRGSWRSRATRTWSKRRLPALRASSTGCRP